MGFAFFFPFSSPPHPTEGRGNSLQPSPASAPATPPKSQKAKAGTGRMRNSPL